MRLRHVQIHNYRCYGDPTDCPVDELTMFVGRNDAGKSAILEALNVFFENAKLDADDRCKHAPDDAEIVITCEFDDLPDAIDLDGGNTTTLQAEYLVTDGGTLKIAAAIQAPRCSRRGWVAAFG